MADFLDILIARSRAAEPVVRPRVPSLFEPVRTSYGPHGEPSFPLAEADAVPAARASDTSNTLPPRLSERFVRAEHGPRDTHVGSDSFRGERQAAVVVPPEVVPQHLDVPSRRSGAGPASAARPLTTPSSSPARGPSPSPSQLMPAVATPRLSTPNEPHQSKFPESTRHPDPVAPEVAPNRAKSAPTPPAPLSERVAALEHRLAARDSAAPAAAPRAMPRPPDAQGRRPAAALPQAAPLTRSKGDGRQSPPQLPAGAPQTFVQVSIGRIEVRALPDQSRPQPPRSADPGGPTTLADYLRRRTGGRG